MKTTEREMTAFQYLAGYINTTLQKEINSNKKGSDLELSERVKMWLILQAYQFQDIRQLK